MLYPKNIRQMGRLTHKRDIKKWYDTKLLIFSDEEMGDFLEKLEDKRFFGFGYNFNSKDVYLTRGLKSKTPLFTRHLFENKIAEIKKS